MAATLYCLPTELERGIMSKLDDLKDILNLKLAYKLMYAFFQEAGGVITHRMLSHELNPTDLAIATFPNPIPTSTNPKKVAKTSRIARFLKRFRSNNHSRYQALQLNEGRGHQCYISSPGGKSESSLFR
ncbi:hypothetical protein HD806DRAFT_411664 [Xylariaceae sp. AK1471]|nr:hypothetical protein HD806DRAFT_411664 [Xylariaceae sp. AK1471]